VNEATERVEAGGVELLYTRVGEGGFPLLLLHGWPETRRIWGRNVGPLAEAGFEVIAPDMRGFGDSGLAPDDAYDTATQSADMLALLEHLGHERCVASGGDFGGVVAQDMSLRYDGLVDRMVLFNTIAPVLPDAPRGVDELVRMAVDYFVRQGRDADGLAAELDTPEKRRAYIATFYGSRFWAAPGTFTREDVELMTEPFGDADHFRASIAIYEYALGSRTAADPPRMTEENPTPTMILYGPEDHVIPRDYPERMSAAFPERVGPFVVEGAGHFLQWEQAHVLNQAIRYFCLDLLRKSRGR